MLTDFYCEFKERKQVAAIYDSYPTLMETGEMETILMRASVSLRKMETDLLGSWWP